ncbi:MAG TPA: BTAD domain-containing putative transcriptional regulator, partial [Solirubrobacteraceae bacterium]
MAGLEDRIDADLACGEEARLVGELEALVREHPLRERLRGQLMLALYRSGRQADALETYRRTRARLIDELGLEPGPELKELERGILAQDPGLQAPARVSAVALLAASGLEQEFPGLRSLNRSNLPVPTGELIGRRGEVEWALALLGEGAARLLTLVGSGGAGKTRLAVEVAAEAAGRYRDGVWMVALASIPDRALMVSELARVLDVAPVPAESLEQTLVSGLSERELLLVLDNFEHLPEAVGLVADLLASAPGVDVLATSREPLRIRGEHRMDVPPLAPEDAAELFVVRARAARPELSLDEDDRRAIDRICARLDRLPLALELAAARVAAFAPRRLESRLAQRLTIPEGPRDLPERQRTLRATIGWSYQLLHPAERNLFEQLSPFIGGVRIDSAEVIWDTEAAERLVSLMEKSLLRRREDPDGELRVSMLETVREFALERAAAEGVAKQAADRHAGYFLALAEQAEPHLHGERQRQWLDRLESDHANLRAALDHLSQREPAQAVRMATNLAWFWDHRGFESEAVTRLTDLLALDRSDDPIRGRALIAAGRFRLKLGEPQRAKSLLLDALPIVQQQGDQRSIALALAYAGWADGALGDDAGMARHYEDAIATARAAADHWALGVALNGYGTSARIRGDSQRALPLVEEALSLLRRIGDAAGVAITSLSVAEIAIDVGDLDL